MNAEPAGPTAILLQGLIRRLERVYDKASATTWAIENDPTILTRTDPGRAVRDIQEVIDDIEDVLDVLNSLLDAQVQLRQDEQLPIGEQAHNAPKHPS